MMNLKTTFVSCATAQFSLNQSGSRTQQNGSSGIWQRCQKIQGSFLAQPSNFLTVPLERGDRLLATVVRFRWYKHYAVKRYTGKRSSATWSPLLPVALHGLRRKWQLCVRFFARHYQFIGRFTWVPGAHLQ